MDEPDSNQAQEASPLDERFNLDSIVNGLATDLSNLRAGKITVTQAIASAQLAKQIFNGLRVILNAQKVLEDRSRLVGSNVTEPNPE